MNAQADALVLLSRRAALRLGRWSGWYRANSRLVRVPHLQLELLLSQCCFPEGTMACSFIPTQL